MKKFLSSVAVVLSLAVLTSCGGNAEKDLVGSWKVDASSVNIELGDAFPEEMKGMVEGGKKEMTEDEEINGLSFDFQEGGKLVVSMEGEDDTQEATWSIDGDKLVIEGEFEGEKGKISLTLDEVSADKVTLSLTAEDLIAQIKEQMPEALEEVPPGMDVEKMAAGTKLTVSLKK